ncbi:MAG: SIS domain-containing protein [Clostridia bacterium]|nr:SIS domain-containing protein [Clostridia bacterium]
MIVLNEHVTRHVDLLIKRYPVLECCRNAICEGFTLMEDAYRHHGKLLIAGNGGSAADAEHIVGELMKSFKQPRRLPAAFADTLRSIHEPMGSTLAEALQGALPAIALDGHFALTTAYMNDVDPQLCFAQQVNGYGTENDVLLGISTSGNSKNVLYAAITAKAKQMKVIGLTCQHNSDLSRLADVTVQVPETETYMIQELHLPIYHCWCLMLEDAFFDKNNIII